MNLHTLRRRHVGRRRAQFSSGFTLIELLISLVIVTGLLLAVLALFDFSNKLARVQTNVADMQQSQRIAQYDVTRLLRAAGRGGLPLTPSSSSGVTTPNPFLTKQFSGAAIGVEDDIAANQFLISGNNATPPVVAGTDILTVRGVFNGQLYQVNYTNPTSFTLTGSPATGGTVTIGAVTPTGIVQDLSALSSAITKTDALVLVSAEDDLVYAVVEINPLSSSVLPAGCSGAACTSATIAFTISGDTTAVAYNSLSVGGTFPVTRLNAAGTSGAVGMVGVLEEYKFYVRNDTTNPALPIPHLSRARFFPNTATSWDGTPAGLQADIADNIIDFQVALGFDRDASGQLTEDRSTSTLAKADEWLFNGPDDDATAAPWPTGVGQVLPRLANVRINTVARTDRRDFQYAAPMIVAIENHTYNLSPSSESEPNGRQSLMFRRRHAQTIIGLRNVS